MQTHGVAGHCEERSDEAIQYFLNEIVALPSAARNDTITDNEHLI